MRHVEVLEIDQVAWSLLILEDLDPYLMLNPPDPSLPTATAKSQIEADLRSFILDEHTTTESRGDSDEVVGEIDNLLQQMVLHS